jgi:hypothetical protein
VTDSLSQEAFGADNGGVYAALRNVFDFDAAGSE